MTKISQSGSQNQATTGSNSPITGNNKLRITKENGKWFFSGFLLPIATGLIVEFFKNGKISEIFQSLIHLVK